MDYEDNEVPIFFQGYTFIIGGKAIREKKVDGGRGWYIEPNPGHELKYFNRQEVLDELLRNYGNGELSDE